MAENSMENSECTYMCVYLFPSLVNMLKKTPDHKCKKHRYGIFFIHCIYLELNTVPGP